jgi:glycosyltransferase involved in cell wall biosynthesis
MQALTFWAGALITAALTPFFAYLLVISAAALAFRLRAKPRSDAGWRGKFFIAIPARDESEAIGRTVSDLRSALEQETLPFSIWVIADNCTDNTARLAAEAGAQVLERNDLTQLGKGYALSYFFSHLLAQASVNDDDAVVLIDADTKVDRRILSSFALRLSEREDWLQGLNAIGNSRASWRNGLLSYAFALINGTWMMGLAGLGQSVPLRGLAMCFTIRGLRRVPWKAFGLAEDFEFGWVLRLARERVRFVPEAAAYSDIVTTDAVGFRTQRQRWESGRRWVRHHFSSAVLRSSQLSWTDKILALLDLQMPTHSLLAAGLGAAIALTGLSAGFSPFVGLWALIQAVMLGVFLLHSSSPLWLGILPVQSAAYLLYAPIYMLWKATLLFRKHPTTWIRTARTGPLGVRSEATATHSKDALRQRRDYVLITPCRDEAEFAQRTIDSVAAQTHLPALWVIVDDGSTDETPRILAQNARRLPYLRILRRERQGQRCVGPGVVDAFYVGFRTIDADRFEYLCKLDLDLELPPRYFELLIERMEAEPRLGTCSGKPYYRSSRGRLLSEEIGDETSVGASKFYRMQSFKEIGGFVKSLMWDGIDCHRCRMLGWIARSWDNPELRFIHLRPMGSSQKSLLAGRVRHGAGQYFMGTGLAYITASVLYRLAQPPFVVGAIAIWWTYLASMIRRKPRYAEPGFRAFLRRYHRQCLLRGKVHATRKYDERAKALLVAGH